MGLMHADMVADDKLSSNLLGGTAIVGASKGSSWQA